MIVGQWVAEVKGDMMHALEMPFPVLDYGPETLLGIVFLMLVSGLLLTKPQIRDKDRTIALQAEQLTVKDEQLAEQAKQIDTLLVPLAQTVDAVLAAVQRGPVRNHLEDN